MNNETYIGTDGQNTYELIFELFGYWLVKVSNRYYPKTEYTIMKWRRCIR